VSFFAALFLAVRLHPFVSQVLRETFIYDGIHDRIVESSSLNATFIEHAPSPGVGVALQERNTIDALPIPAPLRELLYNNNTPAVRDILRVGTLEDFVASFLANIVVNVISMLIVFVIVLIIMKLIGASLHLVDKIPVISSVNTIGGLAVGVLLGAGFVWLGLVVIMIFFSPAGNETVNGLVQGSYVAGWLLENGWLITGLAAV